METGSDTTYPRFAEWLANAMRNADLDIDRQRGGGRAELADRLDVSKSTIARWLGGRLPAPEYLDPLARALKVEPVDMLVDSGIVSRRAKGAKPARSPQDAMVELGITDPADQAAVLAVIDRLKARRSE